MLSITESLQSLGQIAPLVDLKTIFVMLPLLILLSDRRKENVILFMQHPVSYRGSIGARTVWLRVKIKIKTPSQILYILYICIFKC